MKTVALIMAGGRGERFWPASRNDKPKQFLCLSGDDESMIQKTVRRISPIVDIKDVYILTNKMYKQLVQEQLPGIPEANLVLEPIGKNTAPAIELGVEKVKEKYKDAAIIVLPSDHLINDEDAFRNVLVKARDYALNNDALITIGITPTEPNTGYGYIKLDDNKGIHKVLKFAEKPALEIARQYLNEGNYVWNAGMFIFTIKNIDAAFKKYLPEQYNILSHDVSRFSEVNPISIDYGIMEHADNIYCIPGSFGWDDVGSWGALERVLGKDKDGNTIDNKDTIVIDSHNVTIKGTNKKLIATLGVDNLVVVETEDAILVVNKDKLADIKKIRTKLEADKKDRYL